MTINVRANEQWIIVTELKVFIQNLIKAFYEHRTSKSVRCFSSTNNKLCVFQLKNGNGNPSTHIHEWYQRDRYFQIAWSWLWKLFRPETLSFIIHTWDCISRRLVSVCRATTNRALWMLCLPTCFVMHNTFTPWLISRGRVNINISIANELSLWPFMR